MEKLEKFQLLLHSLEKDEFFSLIISVYIINAV